jgi:hypothetical protein
MPLDRTFDAARSLFGRMSLRSAPVSGRWPLLWTLLGAFGASAMLWWLIIAAAKAVFS